MFTTAAASSATSTAQSSRRGKPARALLTLAGAGLLASGVMAAGLAAGHGATSEAAVTNCMKSPSACGYPDASNTGVPAGTTLKTVGTQVTKGPGWYFDSRGWVVVNGNGAVLSGLYIPYGVNIEASNVTLKNDKIVVGGQSAIAVALRHTTNATVENCTISGFNSGSERMMTGVKDVFGDATGTQVLNNNISNYETGVQLGAGLVQGNFIHNPGYITADHTNGIMSNGGGTALLTINHNTVFNDRGQTDAVALFEDFGVQTNRRVTNNLLAGGGYSLYGGQKAGGPASSNIVISGNRFGTGYFAQAGQYGPVTQFDSSGSGNVWSGNVWDSNGSAVSAP